MATKVPEHLTALINKYLEGTATPEEAKQVNQWYTSFNDAEVEVPADSADLKDQIDARLKMRLKAVTENPREIELYPRRRHMLLRVAAAAAIVCIISTGIYFLIQTSGDQRLVKKSRPVKEDARQFENKVTLTLQDGKRIALADAPVGRISSQNGFAVSKTAEGDLTYTLTNAPEQQETSLASNTIATPSGTRVRLTLPDGSMISINASSSFQFPVAFSGSEFNTNLDGEAYFEVTPNKARKFKVRSAMQIVEVLGTMFNISAYRNEPVINTTLLEGSIRITDLNSNNSQLLKPGQKSAFSKTLQISEVEPEGAIAWTEGYFQFDNADIKTVMRELERWYGIKVRYEGKLPSQKFEGAIDKKLQLQQVLGILQKSQVHFKIEGNVVTVMP